MLVCVLLVSLAVAFAQVPTPCQSPTQWEAREFITQLGSNFDEKHRIIYDETNRRERNIAEIEQGSEREFFDILTLWEENKSYSINLRTRQCNVTSIPPTRRYRPRGVPPFARFESIFTLGGTGISGEYVTAQSFAANETDGTLYFGIVTARDCVPIQNVYLEKGKDIDIIAYYDVTVGISDPMAFVPPQECF